MRLYRVLIYSKNLLKLLGQLVLTFKQNFKEMNSHDIKKDASAMNFQVSFLSDLTFHAQKNAMKKFAFIYRQKGLSHSTSFTL